MVEMEPRRSARANKGVHTKRELEEYQVGGVEKTGSHKLSTKNEVKEDHEKVPTTVKKEKIKEEVKDKVFDSNDDNNSVENEDNEEVRCTPCGATTENYDEDNDTLGDMILCDKCKTWQHIKCMGYRKNNVPKVYQCDICSGEPRPANVKQQQQQQQQQKNKKKRAQQLETVLETDSATKKQKTSSSTPEEKEQLDQEEIVTIESLKNPLRISTAKAFYNFFRKSYPLKQGDVEISVEEKEKKATQLALEVEDIIQREFPGKLYVSEGRRILFVLKKQFTDEVFAGTLTLEDVVKKTPEEINQDIARIEQKNRENIKNIILIENDQSQIVRRTHKGEIVKENENEEYDGVNIMDVSIDARPVDHRRFSEENTIKLTLKTLQQSKGRQNAYNHTNPRFGDDFSSDDDAEEEGKEEEEEEGKENTEIEVREMEHGDEEGIDKDGILDGNQTKVSFVDGEEGELLERKKSHSSESLSDIETRSTSDDGKLEELLSGNDDFSQNYNSNSNSGNSGNRKERFEPPEVWHGSITFPEYSHFKAVGKFYSSTDDEQDHYSLSKATAKDILKETNYVVRGRLERARCDKYLNEITATRNLYFVQIQPDDLASPTDATKYKRNYERLYNYFIKENKVGVLSGRPDFVKDSYIMPIDFRDVNLSSAIQAHKRDLRMGLFAVFVVQKHYIPQNVPSKATPPLSHPNPYIQLQPQQQPQPQQQQSQQQQQQQQQHRYQQVQEFHQERHQSSLPPPPSSLPAVPSSLPPIPSMQHGATLYDNDQESNGAEENLSSILDQLK